MQGTQRENTPYEAQSDIEPLSQPVFAEAAERSARQVVPLQPRGLFEGLRRSCAFLIQDRQPLRLLSLVITFALGGGITGALLAAAKIQQQRRFDPSLIISGANAMAQQDIMPQAVAVRRQDNGREKRFVAEDTEESSSDDLRKRSSSDEKKAYLVDEINGRGGEIEDERKGQRERNP